MGWIGSRWIEGDGESRCGVDSVGGWGGWVLASPDAGGSERGREGRGEEGKGGAPHAGGSGDVVEALGTAEISQLQIACARACVGVCLFVSVRACVRACLCPYILCVCA